MSATPAALMKLEFNASEVGVGGIACLQKGTRGHSFDSWVEES